MVPAGLERHGLARLDLDPACYRAHFHDAVLHGHFMNFDALCDWRRAADESVGRIPVVADGEITTADLRTFERGACPGVADVQRAESVLVCHCRHGEQQGGDCYKKAWLRHQTGSEGRASARATAHAFLQICKTGEIRRFGKKAALLRRAVLEPTSEPSDVRWQERPAATRSRSVGQR